MTTRRYGAISFDTSSEDKVYFPDAGITKGDLIDYYDRIAETMLPHLRHRALVMRRAPEGLRGEAFYQKQVPDYFPDWIETVRVTKQGGTQELVVCRNQATLVYLANQGCITPHLWLSRVEKPDHPDRLVIDLDPSDDDFSRVRRAARWCRTLLDELDLPSFVKTTGSRGLHVIVPLDRSADFDEARSFARGLTGVLAARHGDHLTTEVRKNKREGRLFLDVGRNAYAQTAVAPYAVRLKPGAPVATPLDWDELSSSRLHARRYTIKNVFRRLGSRDDPWSAMSRRAVSVATARTRLDALAAET